MLKIFVLEDEWIQQSRIEAVLQDLIRQKSLQCKAPEVFGKSSQLLDAITERGAHHLFFLDIEIKGEEKKGLEIAKEIRKKDPHATIVFVTTHSEFMPITFQYKVAALDFIDKNLNEDLFRLKIKECIEYLTTIQIGNDDLTDYFEYDFKDKKIKIPFKDILYIETVGSAYKLNLVGKNFQKEIAGSLSDVLEKDVEERYFSPHQSFIVNRSMIIGMDKKKKQLLLKEGYSCPISRSNIKRVKKLIEEQNLEFSA